MNMITNMRNMITNLIIINPETAHELFCACLGAICHRGWDGIAYWKVDRGSGRD